MRTHHGRRDPTLLSTVLAVSLLGIAVLGLLLFVRGFRHQGHPWVHRQP
jgi:hypothetical protein